MKEITDILSVFFNIFRNDLLEYYQKSRSYLKDLIIYKKINLTKKFDTENENQVQIDLEQILKAIKTGLNTIGIPIEQLNEYQKDFLKNVSTEMNKLSDYNSYFELYLQRYANILLLDILFDYLLNIDEKKLENVNLFDLLPPYFISKLNEFKRSHFNNIEIVETFKQKNYKKFINFTDLTIVKPEEGPSDNILNQLREAKEGFIETLKTPKKELLKQSIDTIKNDIILGEDISRPKVSKPVPQIEKSLDLVLNTNTFIDYFGNFIPIHHGIINKIKVDKLSLINLKVVNLEFFDLENLYYYISILKMLNIEIPFTQPEIIEIIKKYVNSWVFSSSINNVPDSINIFYGLAIFLELNLLNKTDIIDLQEIINFIKNGLELAVPEKLQLNLYSILCIKLIMKIQKKRLNQQINIGSIFDLDLKEYRNFKPTLDMYHHLTILKITGKEEIINKLKLLYAEEIKKIILPNGSIDDLVTESSRALLILDLLDLKQYENELWNNISNYILTKTEFFTTENLDSRFNWRSDAFAFKIELQMLYWALLAFTIYSYRTN
ncbi:MAG: hypothetical protein ACFE9S_00905 [Candidatus Hermodarchaeota archaeon]